MSHGHGHARYVPAAKYHPRAVLYVRMSDAMFHARHVPPQSGTLCSNVRRHVPCTPCTTPERHSMFECQTPCSMHAMYHPRAALYVRMSDAMYQLLPRHCLASIDVVYNSLLDI